MMVTMDRFFSKGMERTTSDFFSLGLTSIPSYSNMKVGPDSVTTVMGRM